MVYSGPIESVVPYFNSIGVPVPTMINPAEFLLDSCNVDFNEGATETLNRLIEAWGNSPEAKALQREAVEEGEEEGKFQAVQENTEGSSVKKTAVLLHRLWLKSYRDVLAYWIRVVMYMGMLLQPSTYIVLG